MTILMVAVDHQATRVAGLGARASAVCALITAGFVAVFGTLMVSCWAPAAGSLLLLPNRPALHEPDHARDLARRRSSA